jgi:hypothetical protein
MGEGGSSFKLPVNYSLQLSNNVVSPGIARVSDAPVPHAPSVASLYLVAANPESYTSSSHSSVIVDQTDDSSNGFELYEAQGYGLKSLALSNPKDLITDVILGMQWS